jgi:hypothetical protein
MGRLVVESEVFIMRTWLWPALALASVAAATLVVGTMFFTEAGRRRLLPVLRPLLNL